MQTEPQQDNEIVALVAATNEQGAALVALTQAARQALYNAYALVENGEGDLPTLVQALTAFDDTINAMQQQITLDAVAKQVMGETLQKAIEQRDQLADQLSDLQENFEEHLIDRTEYLAGAEEELRIEELAEEIAFGSGYEVAAAQEREVTEARLKRARDYAADYAGELDYDYDNEPDEDEDDTEADFDSDEEDPDNE
jgi:hypothetical protein